MVPRFTEFYIPVLHVMSDVEPIEINKLIDRVADYVQLSEMDRSVITEGGTQLKYRSSISWAVTDLCQGNFIERVKRGHYVITINGLELLEEKPVNIDREYLAKCSNEFKEFLVRRGTRKKNATISERSTSNENRKSASGQIKSENGRIKKDTINETETSLEELYRAIETLRKANISTEELENKILEIEANIIFKNLLEPFSKIIPDALNGINRNLSFSVDYYPNDVICLKFGDAKRTIKIGNLSHNVIKQNCKDNSQNIGAFQHEKKTIRHSSERSIYSNENSDNKYYKTLSTGVWIKPHSDRTIIIDGDTENFIDLFKSYGGIKVNNTKEGRGWIFMRNREEGLRKELKDYLKAEPNDNVLSGVYRNDEIVDTTDLQKNDIPNQKNDISGIDNITNRYIEVFDKLRSFNFLGITGPHKAILLLCIFKGINAGNYPENKIFYTEELESSYNEIWNKHIGGTPTLGAVYPYIHLGRECFFVHKLEKPIRDYDTTWSRHKVLQYVRYAMIDKRLFDLLKYDVNYNILKKYLITRYCKKNSDAQSDLDSDKNLDSIHNTDFKARLVDEKSYNDTQDRDDKKLHESFREYLIKSGTRNGKAYTKSTISVYLGALNSLYLINVICKYNSSGNIFKIKDPKILEKIKQKVDQDCEEKVGSTLCRSALTLYCRFINESKIRGC